MAGSHWEPCTRRASPGASWCGQGQALGLLEGAVLAGLCGERGPVQSGSGAACPPLQEPGGPRVGAAPRDQTRPGGREQALTSARLQLAGQHLPDLAHPGGLDFRSGCLCPEQTRGECVPTVTCASVSLCRCPGPVGTGGQCCTGGAGRSPGARVRWLPGPHPAALTLTQREPSEEGALTTGCAGRRWTLSIPGWCRAGRWLRPLPLQLCGPLAGRAGWCVVSCDQVARASSLPWGHIPQGRQGPDHQACQSCGGQRGEAPPGLSCSLGVSVRHVDAPRAPPSPTPTAR